MPFRNTTTGAILLLVILTVQAFGISIQLNTLDTFIQSQQQNRISDQQKGLAIVDLINAKLDNIGNKSTVLLKDIIAGNTTGAQVQRHNAALLNNLTNVTQHNEIQLQQILDILNKNNQTNSKH